MKLMYGNVPVKSLNIHTYEKNTNDATLKASDMQAGITAYARGQKIVGTGKTFEFAMYGDSLSNIVIPIPSAINVLQIASVEYPVRQTVEFNDLHGMDFPVGYVIGEVIKDGTSYPINIQIANNLLTLSCNVTFNIQLFYGKDNYI